MIPLFQTKFIRKETEGFTAISLGNYHIKGLIVEGGKAQDYFVERNGRLSESIKKLHSERKIPKKKIKVSVKNPSCLVRYFSFPKMDKKKLGQALFYEMNKFIPFDPTEVYFDFFVLKENSPSEVSILLAVAKKNFIDQIIDVFAKINLKISEINLDSVCLTNLFLNNFQEAEKINTCILDIGYTFSTMTILNNGIPFLTRDVKFSAKDIFQVISRIKNIPLAEVEKWVLSLKDNKEFFEMAADSISGIGKEVKSSFDYFEVNKGEHIDKVYISGGLVSVAGIKEAFSEALGLDVSVLGAVPKNKIKLGKSFSSKEFKSFENSFSVPFGLVL